MKKIIGLLGILLCFSCCGCSATKKYSAECYDAFDTVITITAYCTQEETLQQMADIAFARFRELSRLYDIYYPYSDMENLYTINEQAGVLPVKVEQRVIDLLLFCKKIYHQTNGRVNVAMGSVLSLWHDARESGVLPEEAALKAAAAHCDIAQVVVDEAAGTVFLQDPQLQLDVGAVAKGYAAQLVAEELTAQGYTSFVISAGGNVVTRGSAQDGHTWKVGIQSPDDATQLLTTVESRNSAVVTSGGYQRYVEIDGQRYHHIIDPATLMPANYVKSATVLHADSGIADALSTACFLMYPEEAMVLAEDCNGRVILETLDGTILDSEKDLA